MIFYYNCDNPIAVIESGVLKTSQIFRGVSLSDWSELGSHGPFKLVLDLDPARLGYIESDIGKNPRGISGEKVNLSNRRRHTTGRTRMVFAYPRRNTTLDTKAWVWQHIEFGRTRCSKTSMNGTRCISLASSQKNFLKFTSC